MLLEQCRPLNGRRAVCGGICHYGTQKALVPFDGSRSAGTTSPEAGEGRVRRFVRAGSPWLLDATQAKKRLHPRPTLPGFRFQRACRITEDCG